MTMIDLTYWEGAVGTKWFESIRGRIVVDDQLMHILSGFQNPFCAFKSFSEIISDDLRKIFIIKCIDKRK